MTLRKALITTLCMLCVSSVLTWLCTLVVVPPAKAIVRTFYGGMCLILARKVTWRASMWAPLELVLVSMRQRLLGVVMVLCRVGPSVLRSREGLTV